MGIHGLGAFSEPRPEEAVGEIGGGFRLRGDAVAPGHGAGAEAAQLREDEPHPVGPLAALAQLAQRCRIDRRLRLDEALEAVFGHSTADCAEDQWMWTICHVPPTRRSTIVSTVARLTSLSAVAALGASLGRDPGEAVHGVAPPAGNDSGNGLREGGVGADMVGGIFGLAALGAALLEDQCVVGEQEERRRGVAAAQRGVEGVHRRRRHFHFTADRLDRGRGPKGRRGRCQGEEQKDRDCSKPTGHHKTAIPDMLEKTPLYHRLRGEPWLAFSSPA